MCAADKVNTHRLEVHTPLRTDNKGNARVLELKDGAFASDLTCGKKILVVDSAPWILLPDLLTLHTQDLPWPVSSGMSWLAWTLNCSTEVWFSFATSGFSAFNRGST